MHLGLVLTGGGARSAYQAGAVRAIAQMLPRGPLPFDVLAGISAGAINTVALASGAECFQDTAERLAATWLTLAPQRVYRTGPLGLVRIGSRWLLALSAGGVVGRSGINYLLDPSPLRELLEHEVPLGRMHRHLRSGRLRGVAVSATNYHTAAGVTFFEGNAAIEPWTRATRAGLRARLTLDHVMASAAIPLFFPPVRIGRTFYGDGGIRMNFPMSPAVHMGADRILGISVRYLHPPAETAEREKADHVERIPVSEIVGVLLNSVFLDTLDADYERLHRVNRTLALVPRDRLTRAEVDVRQIPALVLRPSQDLGRLAADEYARFPGMLRYLLRGIGASGNTGEDLLSYLAFEEVYIRRVMDLGFSDTMGRRDEIQAFVAGAPVAEPRDLVAS